MAKTYQHDILPLFRSGDLACMRRKGILLGDSGWMCDAAATFGFDDHGNARMVFSRLSAGPDVPPMPPDGPWPQDQIDTYQQWMTDGFQP